MNLKPCPFCDGEALGIDHPPHKHHFVKMPDHPGSYTIECVKCSVGLIATTQAEAEAAWNQRTSTAGVTDGMVGRFLSWRLPKDFGPDCGITFTPINHPDALTHLWPVGTNLLTAVQARKMLEHVLSAPPEVAPKFCSECGDDAEKPLGHGCANAKCPVLSTSSPQNTTKEQA